MGVRLFTAADPGRVHDRVLELAASDDRVVAGAVVGSLAEREGDRLAGPQNLPSQRAMGKVGAVRVASRRDANGRESVAYRITTWMIPCRRVAGAGRPPATSDSELICFGGRADPARLA